MVNKIINLHSKKVFFTGSGTESDNWAIKSAIDNYKERNGLVVEKCDSNAYGKRCCELYQY